MNSGVKMTAEVLLGILCFVVFIVFIITTPDTATYILASTGWGVSGVLFFIIWSMNI